MTRPRASAVPLGGVDLMAMMRFDYFDISCTPEDTCSPIEQVKNNINTHTEFGAYTTGIVLRPLRCFVPDQQKILSFQSHRAPDDSRTKKGG